MTQQRNVGPQPDDTDSDAEALTGVAAAQAHEDAALSAYIDRRLNGLEEAQLEARLATDAVLHARLTQMQHAVTLVRALPTHRPPRSFAIDEVTAARLRAMPARIAPTTLAEVDAMPAVQPAPRRLPIRTALRSAAALVAVLLVAITAFDMAGAFTPATPATPQVAVAAPTQTPRPPRTMRSCDSDTNGSNCIANDATLALPTLRPTPAPVTSAPAPVAPADGAPVRLLEVLLLVLVVLLAAASFAVKTGPIRAIRPRGP